MSEDAGEQVRATVPASGTSQKLPADLGLKGANQQQLAVHGGQLDAAVALLVKATF